MYLFDHIKIASAILELIRYTVKLGTAQTISLSLEVNNLIQHQLNKRKDKQHRYVIYNESKVDPYIFARTIHIA